MTLTMKNPSKDITHSVETGVSSAPSVETELQWKRLDCLQKDQPITKKHCSGNTFVFDCGAVIPPDNAELTRKKCEQSGH